MRQAQKFKRIIREKQNCGMSGLNGRPSDPESDGLPQTKLGIYLYEDGKTYAAKAKQRPDFGLDISGQRIALHFTETAKQILHTTEFGDL